MNKLIVVIMGPGKEHFLEMCVDSVKDADKILYFTPKISNTPKISRVLIASPPIEIYKNFWDEKDKATNGKCRNRYLEHLKEHYPDDWCLVLDEDELIEDLSKVKDFINDPDRRPGLYNVKMRHFIGDLGHEDATRPVHVVPRRLFKISEAKKYPEHSHPVLNVDGEDLGEIMGACLDTTIWHLGHLPVEYMDYILKRYKQHANDSVHHPQKFLSNWKLNHLFGVYPTRQINPIELPKQILDRYELDRDEFYFADRNLELKHFIDAVHWKEFFKCKNAVEFGCGKGPRVFAMNNIGIECHGYDISKFAIQNKLHKNVWLFDILEINKGEKWEATDLVIAYDLLEHINYNKLDIAINNICLPVIKYILISVPVLGDPNLEADSTHIIKEDKDWWIKQFTDKGLKLIPTPEHFLYKEQIMIFEK